MIHPKNLSRIARRRRQIGGNKCPRPDFAKLKEVCARPINSFHIYKGIGTFVKVQTPSGPYFYKDNGANILVVAHLDTVQDFRWNGVLNFQDDTEVYCTTLDDRLGVYITLELLKETGLEYDILLTTNEEQGDSTAQWFEPPKGKKYNWIAEFDRGGSDVVTYGYYQTDWHLALSNVGFKIGYGTYSDISDLDHLGVCGVNIGIGYYDYHKPRAHFRLSELKAQVSRFIDFYKANNSIEFEYAPRYNVLTERGLSYSPYVMGKFSRDEYDLALDLYEQMKAGQSMETLGYKNAYRIIPDNINLPKVKPKITIKKKEATILKHPTFYLDGSDSSSDFKEKGSEDEKKYEGPINYSSKQRVVVYPKPLETTAEEVASDIRAKGLGAVIMEKCIECGDFFSPAIANTEAWCPNCKEVVLNRHSKDDESLPSKSKNDIPFISRWKSHNQKKREMKAKRVIIPPDQEKLDKIAETQIESSLSILNSGKVTAQEVGTILRMVREEIPEELVKPIYDDLIKAEIIRPFKTGKAEMLSNYPILPSGRIQLTHAGMVGVLTKENFKVHIDKSNAVSYQKWLSKVETGHKGVWASDKLELPMFDNYLVLLADLVEDKWLPVINRISSLDIRKMMEELAQLPGKVTELPDKNMSQEKPTSTIFKRGPKVKLGIKFRLDNSNLDYDFMTDNNRGIPIPRWERVKQKATA